VHAETKWLIEKNIKHSLIDDHASMNVSNDTLMYWTIHLIDYYNNMDKATKQRQIRRIKGKKLC